METLQKIDWNEETNELTLLTQFEDGSILSEPLTPEEAAQWRSRHKYG